MIGSGTSPEHDMPIVINVVINLTMRLEGKVAGGFEETVLHF